MEPDLTRPPAAAAPRASAALAVLGAAAFVWGSTPVWWLGLGALAASWVLAGDRLVAWVRGRVPPRRRDAALEFGCVLLVVLVSWAMLAEVAAGDRPVSHDHPVHYFKAWQLRFDLLPTGRLFGWSHRMFAGYPVDYLYPPGADLWVAVVHLLALGALTMSQAYAVAFFLFHAFTGYAVYRFGQRLVGRAAGLVAAVLFLTDTGAFRYGGWHYTIDYGVWPQSLSLAFALLALARLPVLLGAEEAVGGPRRRWSAVGSFGALMGAALICHPMPVLLFPPLAVAATLLLVLYGRASGVGGAVWRLLVAHALGAAVAAAWFLPFLSVKQFAGKYGVFWKSHYQLGAGLLDLDLLEGSWGVVLPAAILGGALLLRRQRLGGQLAARGGAVLLAIGCSSVVDELHFAAWTEAVAHIQFSRVSILLKPFAFVAAGAALVWTLQRAGERGAAALGVPRWRRAAAAGVLAILLGPIAVGFAVDYYTRQVDRELPRASERSDRGDREALVAWLGEQPRRGPLDRVAFVGGHHEHDLVDLAAALDRPIFKSGFTPCSNYLYKMESASPELLEALHVGWVVARKDLRDASAYELAKRFGTFRVYRFLRFRPEPFTLVGDGARGQGVGEGGVELLSFEDEEIVLLAPEGVSGRLRLDVSWFPRWTATRDGESIPIEAVSHPRDPGHTAFMSVDLAPGTYRFVFERGPREHIGAALAALALLLALLLGLGARGVPGAALVVAGFAVVERAADQVVERRARLLGGLLVLGVGAGLVVALMLALWTPPMAWEGHPPIAIERVRYDFLESLDAAEVDVLTREGPEPCPWRLDRFVCEPRDWFHVTSRPERIEGYSTRRCISAHALDEGPLRIAFDDVPVGDAIIGFYGVAESGKKGGNKPVDFRIEVDGEALLERTSRQDAHTHWFSSPVAADADPDGDGSVRVTFTVEAKRTAFRQLCFYAQMVDLEP